MKRQKKFKNCVSIERTDTTSRKWWIPLLTVLLLILGHSLNLEILSPGCSVIRSRAFFLRSSFFGPNNPLSSGCKVNQIIQFLLQLFTTGYMAYPWLSNINRIGSSGEKFTCFLQCCREIKKDHHSSSHFRVPMAGIVLSTIFSRFTFFLGYMKTSRNASPAAFTNASILTFICLVLH